MVGGRREHGTLYVPFSTDQSRLDNPIWDPLPPIHPKIWLFDPLRLLHLSGSGSFQLNHKECETYHSQVEARTKGLA